MAHDPEYCKAHQDRNLWLCYFLPITNCSIPLKGKREAREVDAYFVVRGENAAQFEDMGNAVEPPAGMLPEILTDFDSAKKLMQSGNGCPEGREAPSRNTSLPSPCTMDNQSCCQHWGEVHNGFLLHQVLYRLNYRSRAGVARITHRFTEKQKWQATNCTTLHIRRTDKIAGACINDPHNPAFRQFPGFNRTFSNYMKEATLLMEKVGATRLFIMSDDALFINQNLIAYPHGGNIATMAGHGLMTDVTRGKDATYNGSRQSHSDETHLFFASLHMGGKCRSLITNSASGIAGTLRRYACAMEWKCVSKEASRDLKKFRPNKEVQLAIRAWDDGQLKCRRRRRLLPTSTSA
jgi:hypothetical protein